MTFIEFKSLLDLHIFEFWAFSDMMLIWTQLSGCVKISFVIVLVPIEVRLKLKAR